MRDQRAAVMDETEAKAERERRLTAYAERLQEGRDLYSGERSRAAARARTKASRRPPVPAPPPPANEAPLGGACWATEPGPRTAREVAQQVARWVRRTGDSGALVLKVEGGRAVDWLIVTGAPRPRCPCWRVVVAEVSGLWVRELEAAIERVL